MLKKYLEKQAKLNAQLRELMATAEKEDRFLTDDEEKDFAAAQLELTKVESHIERIKMIPQESQESQTPQVTAGSSFVGTPRVVAEPAKKEFSELAEFFEAAMFNQNDQRLDFVSASQNMGAGSKGGFAIPKQFLAGIRSREGSPALVRPRAEVLPAGTPPDSEISIAALDQEPVNGQNQVYGGVIVKHLEEGGLKQETDFNLREVTLKPKEIAAYIPMTDKLLRNWGAASTYAANQLAKAIASAEDFDFLRGNTAGRALGVIPSAAAYKVNRALASTVGIADIRAMYARFGGDEANAVWVAGRAIYEKLLAVVGDGGGATNIISVNQSTDQVTIYGIPVVRHSRVGALGALGDLGLYDFSQYLIKDGAGPIVETGFATGQWERNMRSVKVTFGVDGTPWNSKPFMFEDNFEVSPFVLLDVPSGS